MRLVVDTNRVIAALIRDSASRKIILSKNADFITIDVVNEEVRKYKAEIMKKSNLTIDEFDYTFSKIMGRMTIISDEAVKLYMPKVKEIMDAIDPGDTPFIAAALAADASIWTDDKHFERQNAVPIIKTNALMKKWGIE